MASEQDGRPPYLRRQRRQPLFRGGVAPVQVLHRQHQGLALTGVQEELPQQRKGPRPALLRAERRQGRRLPGHVQELEQQGRAVLRRHPGRVQPLLDGGGEGVRGGRVGQAPELPQQVAHRQIGGGAAIGQTVAFAVGHRLPVQAVGELRQQPRLAHAGLPGNADHLPLPAGRQCQPLVQQRQLPGPAHQATQGPRAAPRDARPPPQEAVHHIPRHRGGRGVAGCQPPTPRPATSSCTSA